MRVAIGGIARDKIPFASISVACVVAGLVTSYFSLVAKPVYCALLIAACLAPMMPSLSANTINRLLFLVVSVGLCLAFTLMNIAFLPIGAAGVALVLTATNKRGPQAP
jgi:hypothetical protein